MFKSRSEILTRNPRFLPNQVSGDISSSCRRATHRAYLAHCSTSPVPPPRSAKKLQNYVVEGPVEMHQNSTNANRINHIPNKVCFWGGVGGIHRENQSFQLRSGQK